MGFYLNNLVKSQLNTESSGKTLLFKFFSIPVDLGDVFYKELLKYMRSTTAAKGSKNKAGSIVSIYALVNPSISTCIKNTCI